MRRLATEGLTDPSKCKVEADRGYEDVEMGRCLKARASTEGYPKVPEDFTIMEKAPTRAFSWLKSLRKRPYSRGLLDDCEIFGNLRITIVLSSNI